MCASVTPTLMVTDQSGVVKQTFASDLTSATLIEIKTLDSKVVLTGTPTC